MRLILPAALLFASACSAATTAPVNREFLLESGAEAKVEATSIRLHFLGVPADSRCPTDVTCVWSGNAVVQVAVHSDSGNDTLSLHTHDGPREGVVGRYRIELVSLMPEPRSDKPIPPADYRATFKVLEIGEVCTLEARPAIAVQLVDSLAPTTTSFANVHVLAVSATYRDSAFVPRFEASQNQRISLAHEQPGTYTVTVRADGYSPWVRSGVVVQRDPCHVVTVPLTARLR